MSTQEIVFYAALVISAVMFFRLTNQVFNLDIEEKTKAWLYIYLLFFLTSSAYIISRALNGFGSGENIPMSVHGFGLLVSLGFYSFLIRRHMKQITHKT